MMASNYRSPRVLLAPGPMIITLCTLYFTCATVHGARKWLSSEKVLYYAIITLIALVNVYICGLKKPGYVKKSWRPDDAVSSYKFCDRCDGYQPLRSHHCKLCNVCVLKRMHHCNVINNCVGLNNQLNYLITMAWSCYCCARMAHINARTLVLSIQFVSCINN